MLVDAEFMTLAGQRPKIQGCKFTPLPVTLQNQSPCLRVKGHPRSKVKEQSAYRQSQLPIEVGSHHHFEGPEHIVWMNSTFYLSLGPVILRPVVYFAIFTSSHPLATNCRLWASAQRRLTWLVNGHVLSGWSSCCHSVVCSRRGAGWARGRERAQRRE